MYASDSLLLPIVLNASTYLMMKRCTYIHRVAKRNGRKTCKRKKGEKLRPPLVHYGRTRKQLNTRRKIIETDGWSHDGRRVDAVEEVVVVVR